MFRQPLDLFFKPYQYPVYYQSLAIHITEAMRATISNEDLTDPERLEVVYVLNEIQNRIATRLHAYNMVWVSWSEQHMARQLEGWAAGNARVRELMHGAAEAAFSETLSAFRSDSD
jgi:hypothetical protein